MSGINYSFDSGSSRSNTIVQLPGNAIHTVTFAGAEAKEIESKTNGDKFNVLTLKFKNEQGVFEDTIFELRDGDEKRKQNQWGYESPSALEELMFKIKHFFSALVPKVGQQLEQKKVKVGSWKELTEFVVKHATPAVGIETQIKLIARVDAKGNARAQFPSFVLGINKNNETYPRTNFIGSPLAFTAKEQEKINNATTAKPSNVDLLTPAVPALSTSDLDDLSFELV